MNSSPEPWYFYRTDYFLVLSFSSTTNFGSLGLKTTPTPRACLSVSRERDGIMGSLWKEGFWRQDLPPGADSARCHFPLSAPAEVGLGKGVCILEPLSELAPSALTTDLSLATGREACLGHKLWR